MLPRAVERVLICLLYLGLLLVFFHRIVWGGRTFQTPAYEVVSGVMPDGPYNYPGRPLTLNEWPVVDPASSAYNEELAPHAIHRFFPFRPPLWNPYVGCGAPLAANPIYYAYAPLAMSVFAWPGPAMWDFFCLSRLAVAGIGMILLTYRLGARGGGA